MPRRGCAIGVFEPGRTTAETRRGNDQEGGTCQVTEEVNLSGGSLIRRGSGGRINYRKPFVDNPNSFTPDECVVRFVEGRFSYVTVTLPLGSFQADYVGAVDINRFVLKI